MPDRVKLTGYELGMLHCANRSFCRVYLGRDGTGKILGCHLSGYVSGRWWTALSLWLRGYLKRDGRVYWHGYGTPSIYLVITESGRALLASNAKTKD